MNGLFKFNLNQLVIIQVSGEQGEIIGRAEYTHDENRYLLRYKDNQNQATEVWWSESALV